MENLSKKEFSDYIRAMLKQSARNIEFRELLLSNPKEALETVAEKEIPENIIVKVIKDSGKITQILLEEKKYSKSFYWDRYCI